MPNHTRTPAEAAIHVIKNYFLRTYAVELKNQ